jgi:hypothetical protein
LANEELTRRDAPQGVSTQLDWFGYSAGGDSTETPGDFVRCHCGIRLGLWNKSQLFRPPGEGQGGPAEVGRMAGETRRDALPGRLYTIGLVWLFGRWRFDRNPGGLCSLSLRNTAWLMELISTL